MKLSSLAWLSLVIDILLYWCIINREGVVNFISFKLYKCCRALWDYFYVFHRPDLCNLSTKYYTKNSQYLWNKHSMGNALYDFFIHSVISIRRLTRSLRSHVRFLILLNSWIKIVRLHLKWRNLYILTPIESSVLAIALYWHDNSA